MSTKINTLHKQGLKALQSGQIQQAHALLVELVTLEPGHADGYFLLAMVNLQIGQVYKAIALINKALSFKSKIEYCAHLAKCYALIGDLNKAKCTAL